MISAFRQAQTPPQSILKGVRSAFLLFNLVGFILYPLEITILGHWLSSFSSKLPYIMAIPGFIFTALMLYDRKTSWIHNGFVIIMALVAVTGLLGFAFHVIYNFEGKIDWRFLSTIKALDGSRPALAPLAFTHIGLTGLLCTYKAR
jgi:hypothetical protein